MWFTRQYLSPVVCQCFLNSTTLIRFVKNLRCLQRVLNMWYTRIVLCFFIPLGSGVQFVGGQAHTLSGPLYGVKSSDPKNVYWRKKQNTTIDAALQGIQLRSFEGIVPRTSTSLCMSTPLSHSAIQSAHMQTQIYEHVCKHTHIYINNTYQRSQKWFLFLTVISQRFNFSCNLLFQLICCIWVDRVILSV